MKFPMMLGNALLEQAELIINQSGVQIIKSDPGISPPTIDINLVEETGLDIGDNVSKAGRQEIEKLVEGYMPNKTKDTNVETVIIMKDEEPIFCPPRRHPPAEKKVIDNQVQEWIGKKIVEPCTSEYSSPVVVVKKRTGLTECALTIAG